MNENKALNKNNFSSIMKVIQNEIKDIIIDKYIYRNTKYAVVHPAVKSSVTFTTGIQFFVLRISTFTDYESLRIVDDTPIAYNWGI